MQQMARGDMNALAGIFTAVGLGMAVEKLRLETSGRGDELKNYGLQDWIRAGMDRSGAFTIPFEAFNMLDRAMEGHLSQKLELTEGSRYFYRNFLGTLGGPIAGSMEDAYGLLQNISPENDFTASDAHQLRKLMPYQNMFYTRWLLDQMEETAVEELDLEDNRRKR
jgi:hypothetical protein